MKEALNVGTISIDKVPNKEVAQGVIDLFRNLKDSNINISDKNKKAIVALSQKYDIDISELIEKVSPEDHVVSDKDSIKLELEEEFPKELDNLSKYTKNTIKVAMKNAGIDIENTDSQLIDITSSRDPLLKDPKAILIFKFDGSKDVAVTRAREVLSDMYLKDGKYFSQVSWKTILSLNPTIKALVFNDITNKAMVDKQKKRANDKSGSINRHPIDPKYTKNYPSYNRGGKYIDKSGYTYDPNKYKNMLAASDLSNYESLIEDTFKLYNDLSSRVMDFRNKPEIKDLNGISAFTNSALDQIKRVQSDFLSTVDDLDKSLKDYNRLKAENKDGVYSEYIDDYITPTLIRAIKELRNTKANIAKILDSANDENTLELNIK